MQNLTTTFPTKLSTPATRALLNAEIDSLKKLSTYSEEEILKLHGMGPGSLPLLREALKKAGLSFKK
jgi:DNA-directed RNA polymerase alpha subunit